MVAYNFRAEFVRAIESGRKHQTIRSARKRHARPGERVQIYTGQRTRACRKIIPDPVCVFILPVCIDRDRRGRLQVELDNRPVRGQKLLDFVRADGFELPMQMRDFFAAQYGLPFRGFCIRWIPAKGVQQ